MLNWIDSLPRDGRFLLHYLPIAGHHPYATPQRGPFPDSTDAGQYLNALHFGDAALGTFLEGLRQRGLDTNTSFVLYGDHGEAFGEHEGNFGHTLFVHEENIHVPLLIAAPGAWASGRRIRRVASLIDVAPTVLDLLGLPAPGDYQGASLLEPRQRDALFFTDYSLRLAGLRSGRWKFVVEIGTAHRRLFDLEADPDERHDVAPSFPRLVDGYGERVAAWVAAQKPLLFRPVASPLTGIRNRCRPPAELAHRLSAATP